ncbi:hypothetical protein LX88_007735 [Lentzea californiensis]|nr:hypothetical protein [Lentzea californiensis]
MEEGERVSGEDVKIYVDILLAEYKALRDEIIKKMDHRTTLRVSATTLSLAAVGVGVERRSSAILLLVPVIVALLANMANFQTVQIGRLSRYIEEIEGKLVGLHPGVIGWHTRSTDRKLRFRQIFVVYHLPNLTIVLAPAFLAMTLGWIYSDSLKISVILTCFDTVVLGLFLWNFVKNRHNL